MLLVEVLTFSVPSTENYMAEPVAAEVFKAVVTAYNSDPAQTDSRPLEMASGKEVYDGAVACPPELKFGTKVAIKGKVYVCEDRMAKKFSQRFDVWMPSREDAVQWGKQELAVQVLK